MKKLLKAICLTASCLGAILFTLLFLDIHKSIKNHDKEITRQGKIIDSIWYETKINARFRANHIQHCGQTLNEHARRMLDEGKEIYSY